MGNYLKKLNCEIKTFCKSESGQSMVEYGLIIALVFLVVLPVVILVGGEIVRLYKNKIAPILFPSLTGRP